MTDRACEPFAPDFGLPGVTVEADRDLLVVRCARPLRCLSSALVGGGFAEVRTILSRYVDKDYNHDDPARELAEYARGRGIEGPFVGLMTAVRLAQARAVTVSDGDLALAALVTAGTGNATAPGVSLPYTQRPGTINVILLADARLTPGAMVNAVLTVTEVKTALLGERGVRTPEGALATGTSTDAVVIACTGRGAPTPYAGPATPVGWLIGRALRQALEEALDAYGS
jgi:iron complex transport system ATP-binding protein